MLPGLQFYYAAFLDVSTDRHVGMAEGPIPWTAIDRYAVREGLEGEEYERFFALIRAMDAEYLRHQENKAKRS